MPFVAVNPSDGTTGTSAASLSRDELVRRADRAREAFEPWARTAVNRRAAILARAADELRARSSELALLMAREMGKPVSQGASEVEKCAWAMKWLAAGGPGALADVPVEVEEGRAFWSYRPLGPVLAIMPWNFPLWQVFRAAGPALLAGNPVLLKHAPGVPGCARVCEEIFHGAGVPADVFQNLFAEVEDVPLIIGHRGVAGVTFTGSVRGGRQVATLAGEHLKKCVLELGGSDPYLILEDADVELAAERCVTSRLINAGQSCIAAKRLIVVDGVHDAFVERVRAHLEETAWGDPTDPDTTMGPMARTDLRDTLHVQVETSVALGAALQLGGRVPDRPGAWYPPTLLTEVTREMPAFREELFGPVAAVVRARDDDHAIELANDTTFGLGAAVFTADRERGERIARDRLHAGACFVNDFVRSDPRLPFGGVQESGYGRELSPVGVREFTNVKTVWVR
jgi:succinate-semialdehyde dehydrogenase/glutarate-semialdehyde dehydrogenase